MFDYSYHPEGFADELKHQIQHFHHKAQLILNGESFFELGNAILRAQIVDKYFELLVILRPGFKTIEISNLLHRLVQGGARVGVLDRQSFGSELKELALFDSKLLISTEYFESEIDLLKLVSKKQHDFRLLMESSEQVYESSEQVKIRFWADKYFVQRGTNVNLHWEIEQASSSFLNPGSLSIKPIGNQSFTIEKDTLFTISSRNAKNKRVLTIFIKCIAEEPLQLSLFVFNKQLSKYLKLDPLTAPDGQYAVYEGDLLRLDWNCNLAYKLVEKGLGELKNIGNYNFIVLSKRSFEFKASSKMGDFTKQLMIHPFSANEKFLEFSKGLEDKDLKQEASKGILKQTKQWWLAISKLKKH